MSEKSKLLTYVIIILIIVLISMLSKCTSVTIGDVKIPLLRDDIPFLKSMTVSKGKMMQARINFRLYMCDENKVKLVNMKIGFVDYYLDNWHANYYPGFLRDAATKFGYDADVFAAYAVKDSDNGKTTDEWCREHQMKRLASIQALAAEADALMVIAADDSRFHDYICPEVLTCGKPVFVDKTFAKDTATGREFFSIASRHGTPVFSASAQRYCQSVLDYLAEPGRVTRFMSTVGPHSLDNYAVHQLEPIVAVMGIGVKRIKCFSVGEGVTQLIMDYGDGRIASFTQSPQPWAEFNFMVSDGNTGRRLPSDDKDFYENLMKAILEFFKTGIAPVKPEETLEILRIIDIARTYRDMVDIWVDI